MLGQDVEENGDRPLHGEVTTCVLWQQQQQQQQQEERKSEKATMREGGRGDPQRGRALHGKTRNDTEEEERRKKDRH